MPGMGSKTKHIFLITNHNITSLFPWLLFKCCYVTLQMHWTFISYIIIYPFIYSLPHQLDQKFPKYEYFIFIRLHYILHDSLYITGTRDQVCCIAMQAMHCLTLKVAVDTDDNMPQKLCCAVTPVNMIDETMLKPI